MSVYKTILHRIKLSYIQSSILDYIKKEDLEYYLSCFNPTGTPKSYIEMISNENIQEITNEIIRCYKEKYGAKSAYFPSFEKELYEIIRSLMTTGSVRISTNQDLYVMTNLCNLFDEIGIFNYNEDSSLEYFFDLTISN
jgi:hypothetical protein